MAKNNNQYRVPASQRNEFDRLVDRANRTIKQSLQYVQQQDFKSEAAKRAILHQYGDPATWAGKTIAFSRRKTFEDKETSDGRTIKAETMYKAYTRHLEQFARYADQPEKRIKEIREGYRQNIIKALTTAAIDNDALVNGKLPSNLIARINNLTFEQMVEFFGHNDPIEQIETQGWASEMYFGTDPDQFADVTHAHINKLRELYPAKRKARSKGKAGRSRKRAKK